MEKVQKIQILIKFIQDFKLERGYEDHITIANNQLLSLLKDICNDN